MCEFKQDDSLQEHSVPYNSETYFLWIQRLHVWCNLSLDSDEKRPGKESKTRKQVFENLYESNRS